MGEANSLLAASFSTVLLCFTLLPQFTAKHRTTRAFRRRETQNQNAGRKGRIHAGPAFCSKEDRLQLFSLWILLETASGCKVCSFVCREKAQEGTRTSTNCRHAAAAQLGNRNFVLATPPMMSSDLRNTVTTVFFSPSGTKSNCKSPLCSTADAPKATNASRQSHPTKRSRCRRDENARFVHN